MRDAATERQRISNRMMYFQGAWNSIASMKMWDAIEYMDKLPIMDEKNEKGYTIRGLCKECKRIYTNKENLTFKSFRRLNSFFLDYQDNIDDAMEGFVDELNVKIMSIMERNNYTDILPKSMAMTAYILLNAAKDYFKGVMAKSRMTCGKDFSKEFQAYNIYSVSEKWWDVVSLLIKNDKGIDYKADKECMDAFIKLERYISDARNIKEIVAVTALRNDDCNKNHKTIINTIKEWMQEK